LRRARKRSRPQAGSPADNGPDSSGGGGPRPILLGDGVRRGADGPRRCSVCCGVDIARSKARALRPPLAVQIAADAAAESEFARAPTPRAGSAGRRASRHQPDNILLSLEGRPRSQILAWPRPAAADQDRGWAGQRQLPTCP
jgi:hypothetical protein